MADKQNVCFVLAIALSVGLVVYGFMQLLQKEKASENELQVIQRQLRGFAYLMLAQLLLVLGMSLCVGLDINAFKNIVKSVRM